MPCERVVSLVGGDKISRMGQHLCLLPLLPTHKETKKGWEEWDFFLGFLIISLGHAQWAMAGHAILQQGCISTVVIVHLPFAYFWILSNVLVLFFSKRRYIVLLHNA